MQSPQERERIKKEVEQMLPLLHTSLRISIRECAVHEMRLLLEQIEVFFGDDAMVIAKNGTIVVTPLAASFPPTVPLQSERFAEAQTVIGGLMSVESTKLIYTIYRGLEGNRR